MNIISVLVKPADKAVRPFSYQVNAHYHRPFSPFRERAKEVYQQSVAAFIPKINISSGEDAYV